MFLFLPYSIFKNTDSFHKLIFRGMNWSDLEYFSKHSVCLRQNFQGIGQNYQCKPSIEARKYLFSLLKPKWYLDNKLFAF